MEDQAAPSQWSGIPPAAPPWPDELAPAFPLPARGDHVLVLVTGPTRTTLLRAGSWLESCEVTRVGRPG